MAVSWQTVAQSQPRYRVSGDREKRVENACRPGHVMPPCGVRSDASFYDCFSIEAYLLFQMLAFDPKGSRPSARKMAARDLSFVKGPIDARWYMGGDPVPSAFLSALSATFPLGERFFMESVRRFRGRVDAETATAIDAFVIQEAFHTREHLALNRVVEKTGYSAAAMTDRTREVLAPFRARSELDQLGLTMALEHFTALFAHEVLRHDHRIAPAPAAIRALWRWHAMEEIEHKAVAFDVFMAVTRAWTRRRRYAFRVRSMLAATRILLSVVARNMDDLFQQDRLPRVATWSRALMYFFAPRGVLTSMAPGYLAWFRTGFHPWQTDDYALAEHVGRELSATLTYAAAGPA